MMSAENSPQVPLREKAFYTTCLFIGRVGKAIRYRVRPPYFIIGTGRCGTTLLVQILKSHSGIAGFPTEANELWHPRLEPYESAAIDIPPIEINPQHFTAVSVANWPCGHAENLRDTFAGFHLAAGPSKAFFVKSAEISFMIPKILEIFPDARFIHIYRFGPSVVQSYFRKNFGKYSKCKFTEKDYRIYLAKYWNACILEIDRIKGLLSLEGKGQFLEFSYESLCRDPRRVLDHAANFLQVPSGGFTFDLSRISSQNAKVADQAGNHDWDELLEIMSPGMRAKGYSFHLEGRSVG